MLSVTFRLQVVFLERFLSDSSLGVVLLTEFLRTPQGRWEHILFVKIPSAVDVFISASLSSPSIAHTRARALSHPNLWRRSFVNALIVGMHFKIDKESCIFYF